MINFTPLYIKGRKLNVVCKDFNVRIRELLDKIKETLKETKNHEN